MGKQNAKGVEFEANAKEIREGVHMFGVVGGEVGYVVGV